MKKSMKGNGSSPGGVSPRDLRELAEQLQRPSGKVGQEVAAAMARGNAAMVLRAARAAAPEPHHRILEIGPGGGELALDLVAKLDVGGAYVAVEHSPDMAQLTEARLRAGSLVATQVLIGTLGDSAIETALGEQSFDLFVAVNVVYFVADLASFYEAAAARLSAGGRSVIGIRSDPCVAALPFTQFGFHRRSLDVHLGAMAAAGFIEIRADYSDEGRTEFDGHEFTLDSIIITAVRGGAARI